VTAGPAPGGAAPEGSVTLSTHVLDATAGRPAAGVPVRLEHLGPDGWRAAGQGRTGADGRLGLAGGADGHGSGHDSGHDSGPGFEPGVYRITFGSGAYFEALGTASFYPEVTVTFEMTSRGEHYHVPLLLSPFAYSTYRGS
jgi:5-hydroxyisourate hydrolase